MSVTPKGKVFETRLRFGRDAAGKPLRRRFIIVIDPETTGALERANEAERVMQTMANQLAAMGDADKAIETLTEAGKIASDPKKLQALSRAVDKASAVVSEMKAQKGKAPGASTFRDVVEMWTSGKLTELYPDHKLVPDKSAAGRAADLQMASTFFPALGGKAIGDITAEDIDAARRLIPKDARPNTRRNYILRLRLVMRLAESPLRLIERAPLVEVPRKRASNLFGFIYPQEEALLIGNTAIPLLYRVLYGYLARNGCRIGESLQLTWDHIDLETGDIHIDKRWTKTKRARRWVLDADVLEAFEAYYRHRGEPPKSALVFPGRDGKSLLSLDVLNRRLIGDLRDSGVTRKSIVESGDGTEPLRVHDLRASFVTLSLRRGRDIKWIMTRTGHQTLGVLSVYDRLVEDANEHRLPEWFVPMAQAIPELRARRAGGPSLGQGAKSEQEMARSHSLAWTSEPGQSEQKPAVKATSVTTATTPQPTSGPAGFQGVGQAGPGSAEVQPGESSGEDTSTSADTVERLRAEAALALVRIEESLTQDIKVALAASRFELAERLLAELGERRRARTAPEVRSLDAARKRRDEGGK